jgi:SAM-dependent methyltransferase
MRSDGVLPDLRRVGVGSTDEPTRGSIDDQRPARHRRAAREVYLPDVGVVHRRAMLPAELFTTGYSLYTHSSGAPREAKGQDGYASWIAGQLAAPPATVLDVGCGNGSPLLALERLWPQAVTRGIDPSPQSVQFARADGHVPITWHDLVAS